MYFINQVIHEQIVPERAAAKNQDLFASLLFKSGNLLVRVCSTDNAGRTSPRFGLFCGHIV